MTMYTEPTGNAGTMRMDDNGVDNVDLYLLGVNELVEQVPWAYTLDGVMSSWKSFRLEPNLAWQKLTTLFVGSTQDVTFHLGASGNALLGGPQDMTVDIQRGDLIGGVGGGARIPVDGIYKNALVWLNDQGEWKPVQPWAKKAGVWRPST